MLDKLKKLPFYEDDWFQFIFFVIRRFEADRCREQSAALTYTTLFAVVPMLTVFLVIVSSIKTLEPARQQLQQMIYSNFLPKSTIAFDKALSDFTAQANNLTIIGIALLFVTTVMMLTSIEEAFNRIWRVHETRGGIMGFMRYWTIISLGPIILGSAFVISSTITSINFLNHNFADYQLSSSFFLWLISFTLTAVGFFVLYWTVPNRSVPFYAAAISGLFSAIVFELLKNLFGEVMSHFTSYEIIYGAFAAVPIFLFWIYLSWNIILLGVEISYALTAFHSSKIPKRHPVLMLLDILALFYQKQKVGQSLSDAEALNILGRGEMGHWPRYVEMLEQQHLIKRTENDHYVLCRNLAEVDFWNFFTALPYALPRQADLCHLLQDHPWIEKISPALVDADQYLGHKLAIPLASLFEQKKDLH